MTMNDDYEQLRPRSARMLNTPRAAPYFLQPPPTREALKSSALDSRPCENARERWLKARGHDVVDWIKASANTPNGWQP
jgi:hypothetical protein